MNLRLSLWCLVVGVLVVAQTPAPAYTGLTEPSLAFGAPAPRASLLDLSRMSLRTGIVFGYSSGGGLNQSAGVIHTTLGYTFNPRLHMQATMSKDFSFSGGSDSDQGVTLSGFQVDWRPIDSMHLHVEFNRYPTVFDRSSIWNPW